MRKIATTAAALATLAAVLVLPAAAGARGHRHARQHARHARDANHDRIPDRWERRYRLSLRVKQTRRDPDHDGLANLAEYRAHTNPRRADTDRDGLRDGAEQKTGNDPTNPDTDGDGVPDGSEHAGRIASFQDGVLTILLANGETLSGRVDADTAIYCDSGDGSGDTAEQSSLRQEPSGDGGDQTVDDPGAGDEQGDDPGADDPGDASGDASGSDSGSDSGNDQSGDGGSGDAGDCSPVDLTPGRYVHEASLLVEPDGLLFDEVDLVP